MSKIIKEKTRYIRNSNGNENSYLIKNDNKYYIISGWGLQDDDAKRLESYYEVGSYGYKSSIREFDSKEIAQKEFESY